MISSFGRGFDSLQLHSVKHKRMADGHPFVLCLRLLAFSPQPSSLNPQLFTTMILH